MQLQVPTEVISEVAAPWNSVRVKLHQTIKNNNNKKTNQKAQDTLKNLDIEIVEWHRVPESLVVSTHSS